jgi:hypothetical protein
MGIAGPGAEFTYGASLAAEHNASPVRQWLTHRLPRRVRRLRRLWPEFGPDRLQGSDAWRQEVAVPIYDVV